MSTETSGIDHEAHQHQPPHGHHHEIHFFVDGERHETHHHEMTPNHIIREFAHKDPATHYLVRIEGHHRTSYQGNGEEPIKLHNGERFQVISTGPTPVS
jgi:hypothetical protein